MGISIARIREKGHSKHIAARSLIFAFPDPSQVAEKKPMPFDKASPVRNLSVRIGSESSGGKANISDLELSMNEYSGTVAIQQLAKSRRLID